MAFWNAPQQVVDFEKKACLAAYECKQMLCRMREFWSSRGGDFYFFLFFFLSTFFFQPFFFLKFVFDELDFFCFVVCEFFVFSLNTFIFLFEIKNSFFQKLHHSSREWVFTKEKFTLETWVRQVDSITLFLEKL